MTELGRCVDKLEVDLLKSGSLRVGTQGLELQIKIIKINPKISCHTILLSPQNMYWFYCNILDTHLPQSDDTLLGSHTATLDHDEVIVDFSIVGETTHGGDGLLRQVVFSRSIILNNLAILGVDS